jgi:hypothetical protein
VEVEGSASVVDRHLPPLALLVHVAKALQAAGQRQTQRSGQTQVSTLGWQPARACRCQPFSRCLNRIVWCL